MRRRDFIINTSLMTAGITMAEWNVFGKQASSKSLFESIDASWKLNDDGTYNLNAGEVILDNCYPAFDGKPVSPISVEVNRGSIGGTITYILKDGKLILDLSSSNDSLVLKSKLEIPVAPHYFYPLAFAKVIGANRFFKQGLGFSGPSGIFDIPQTPLKRESHQPDEAWSYDSYLASGFFSSSGQALAIGAYKHDNYLQRSTFYNRSYRFGLIDRYLNDNILMFEAGFATEQITSTAPLEMPELHFIAGTQPFSTFRQLAENIARANNVVLKNQPRYQWCSWYEWESEYTQEKLDDMITGLKSINPPIPVEMLQIDDGYSERGDWLIENKKFPKGIKYMVDSIIKAGYRAGIWVAPFMVSSKSKLYQEHPDWMLKDINGNLISEFNSSDANMYVLDTSHPGAFEHIRNVFRTLKKWGVTYYKTDFMDWGLRDRTLFKRHDNNDTSVQHFVNVIRTIREEIGKESYWLACISPYPPFIGITDAARFSNDIPSAWYEGSQGNLIQEGTACHYFQHVFWQNDPDTIFLRDLNSNLKSRLTPDEAFTIAMFDGMIGGFITTSDRFHKITPEYLNLWRFLQPGKVQMSCRFPYWAANKKLKVVVRDYPDTSAWAVLVTNPAAININEEYPVKELTGLEKAWFFDWKPGENKPAGELQKLSVTLGAHESKLFYVNKTNTPPSGDLGLFGIKVKGLKKISGNS